MLQKQMINIRQFTILVILITIGDAILILPYIIVNIVNQDAWIATIISLGFGLLIIYLFVIVGNLYPKLSLIQSSQKIFGKWIGAFFSSFFLFYLFLSAVTHIREFGDFMTTHILATTPIQVIHFLFLFIIIYGVRLGLEPIARTAELIFPFVCFFLAILIVLSLPEIDFILIKPILTNGIKPILLGSFSATAFPFMELIVFLMIWPNIKQSNKTKKNFFIGAFIGGIILSIIVGLCILTLGIETTKNDIYPTFTLARIIQIDGFLQRIEGILAITWTITMYFKIILYVYALHVGLAHLFNLNTYRRLSLPIGMIMLACALTVTPNISYFLEVISKYWQFYDFTIAIFFPFVLLIVYKIRKHKNWIH